VKRSKKNTIGRFLGAILGICLLCGCSKPQEPADIQEPQEEPVPVREDWSCFNGVKVQAPQEISLYDAQHKEAGRLYAGSYVDIEQDTGNGYVKLRDEDYYVRGSEVQEAQRWFDHRTSLLPSDEIIRAGKDHVLYDRRGNALLQIKEPHDYRVYVRAEGERWGVLFQNCVCFIDPSDVTESWSEPAARQEADRIPVLMYHFFYSEEKGETRIDGNYVEQNELRSQLQWLKDNGWTTLTMEEVLYFMQGRASVPRNSVAITIDDGDPSVHEYAFPLFVEYGMKATLFIIGGWGEPTMSWDLWEMREAGLELQSHGFLTHQGGCPGMGHGGRILCMDYNEGVQDTIMSFDYVDGGFVYCYPFGDVNEHAKQILRDAGALMAFTTEPGIIYRGMDLLELPRVRVIGGNGLATFAGSLGN